MKALFQPAETHDSGFTILEALLVVVIIGLAAAAASSMFTVALRGLNDTRETYSVQRGIEANKVEIDRLAREFTCCSGICTTTPPTTFGANQPCATNNPNDDRYYFPQLDDPATTANLTGTTTPSEPIAVDQRCQNTATANTAFMTPLKNAIDALAQPTPATRNAAVILDYKMLRVDFTEPGAGVVVRSLYVKPRMANFCS